MSSSKCQSYQKVIREEILNTSYGAPRTTPPYSWGAMCLYIRPPSSRVSTAPMEERLQNKRQVCQTFSNKTETHKFDKEISRPYVLIFVKRHICQMLIWRASLIPDRTRKIQETLQSPTANTRFLSSSNE